MIKDLTILPTRCGNCNEEVILHAKDLEGNIEYLDGKNSNFTYEVDCCPKCLYSSLDLEKSTNMGTKLKVKTRKYKEIFEDDTIDENLRTIEAALFLTKDKKEEYLLNMYAAWHLENIGEYSDNYRRKANKIFNEEYKKRQIPLKNVLENIDSTRILGEMEESLEKINRLKEEARKAGYKFSREETNFLELEENWNKQLDKTPHTIEEIK